ncbi:MAG: S24/S26 family peptidase [Tidjanibacter sp.]|nr:S24/S26 family peptidase [Tidjanibacter sp.]MBR7129475.1 S24/S26 family peptidase [Tidjanibacter sp.]
MPTKQIANDLFFASAEEFLREGRSVELRVKGFSMRPFLRNGRDVVVLAPVEEGVALRKGMVVLFRYRGRHVLHRVRRVDGGSLVIEGDGNYRTIEHATTADVVAWVSEVRLDGGPRGFAYGSCRWRGRSAVSLTIKALRTVAIDVKRKIIG